MVALDIRKSDEIVAYETTTPAGYYAYRCAWTLKVFGHPNVRVLQGPLPTLQHGPHPKKGQVSIVDFDFVKNPAASKYLQDVKDMVA